MVLQGTKHSGRATKDLWVVGQFEFLVVVVDRDQADVERGFQIRNLERSPLVGCNPPMSPPAIDDRSVLDVTKLRQIRTVPISASP